VRELVQTGVFSPYEKDLIRADGERVTVIQGGAVTDVSAGRCIAYLLDVTKQRSVEADRARLYEAERKARGEAEAASRMKDDFLATVSHEIRTPLNAMLGWATMAQSRKPTDPTVAKALDTIERNAKAQAKLIDDILDVSRIVSGKLKLALEAVDVAAVVNAALDVVRPATLAKGVELRADIGECGFLTADADRLQQVVWNLLINAVRFTPPGGTIEVIAARSDSNVQIVVRDSGAGIPPEHLAHVFERFRQVDSSTTRKHGGLGLGLAIVRHVVELHGGVVTAESGGPDLGATFTVSLPVRAVLVTDAGDRLDDGRARPGRGDWARALDGVEILVAEDDADSRELVESLLSAAGARVTTAASAAEAFERLLAKPPRVLISDIGMPGEDGYALMRRVRALPADHPARSVRAIALTAYARKEDERLAVAAGYDRHVAKPVEPALLLEVVADIARGRAPE
jgi:signal transduction histidine kinase/ActR/RegA family two-component response regulator